MKAIIILNYASEEDIGKKASIRLRNEEIAWIEEVVIKPMPEKKEIKEHRTGGYIDNEDELAEARGWNACLEEIEK